MNRYSTATLVVLSIVTGAVATALAAVTKTGVGGIYLFMFLGMLGLGIFLLWPDIRARFSRPTSLSPRAIGRHGRSRSRSSSRRTPET